jgi:aminoglycoside phosphotransferase (APT) family kinase protein
MLTDTSDAVIEQAGAALKAAGFHHDARTLHVHPRDDRLAIELPGGRMAWFALNEQGRAMLGKERRVLKLLRTHCSFSAPRVLYEDVGGWDVRELVPGVVDPAGLYARIQRDPVLAYALGEELGRMLAEQHTCIPPTALEGWLPTVPNWPRPEDLPCLPKVIDDARLLHRMGMAIDRYVRLPSGVADPTLVHGDLGLHNIAIDPPSERVAGIFDYEGAMYGDRHQDFKYMVFHIAEEPMLDGALAVYESTTRIKIDRDRVQLLNAVAAIGFLAFRHGHAPEEKWCGRTLAEDIAWTNAALGVIGL